MRLGAALVIFSFSREMMHICKKLTCPPMGPLILESLDKELLKTHAYLNFCDVQLSSGKKQVFENTCLKPHACLVDPLFFLVIFVFSKFHVFFDTRKESPSRDNGAMFRNCVPEPTKGAHFDSKREAQKGAHCWCSEEARGLVLAAHPVCSSFAAWTRWFGQHLRLLH